MMLAPNQIFVPVHSVYPYDTHCLRNDSTGSVDQYMEHLGTELKDYTSGPFIRNVEEGKEDVCPNQLIDSNTNLDVFANAFFGNVELKDSIVVSFSKISDLLFQPSSIVLLFSITVTGIFLNSLKKFKKSTSLVRKGFSQRTRERTLRKQNHKCVYCRKVLTVIDYHHKNGDRSDNREKNCQALCPNCHALKTRNRLVNN
jgi:hypothetical protein